MSKSSATPIVVPPRESGAEAPNFPGPEACASFPKSTLSLTQDLATILAAPSSQPPREPHVGLVPDGRTSAVPVMDVTDAGSTSEEELGIPVSNLAARACAVAAPSPPGTTIPGFGGPSRNPIHDTARRQPESVVGENDVLDSMPSHSREWVADLESVVNKTSVELKVLADTAVEAWPWVRCRKGDVVAGVARGHPTSDAVWCWFYRDGLRCEGAIARGLCQMCEPYDFVLQISAEGDTPLGIRGSVKRNGLAVEGVRAGGLVDRWNRSCTQGAMRNIVRVGDVIVSANGVVDPAGMLTALRHAEFLCVCFQRGSGA